MHKHLSLLGLLGCLLGTAKANDLPHEAEKIAPPASTELITLYIGTYTQSPQQGICVAYFNAQTGEVSPAQIAARTANPSFLAASPDGRFLYAVNESGQVAGKNQGGLSAFRIEPDTYQLTPINSLSVGGTLCHLTIDSTGKWLLAAAYSEGTVSTWPLQADGSISKRAFQVQHTGSGPNQGRQNGPHAHHVVLSPDNHRAFTADLGTDQVVLNTFDATTGELGSSTPPFAAVASGAGPRHLALTPSGQYLYVTSELTNTITAFKDALDTPQQIQIVSTLPADFTGQSFAAEIAVRPDGRFLYASNRGHDSIACYAIADDGQLTLVGFASTGHNPRHFTFDPSGKWLLVANQNDKSLTVFSMDAQSGSLTPSSHLENIPGNPVCLVFAPPQLKR